MTEPSAPAAAPPGPAAAAGTPEPPPESVHAGDVGRATAVITIARGVQMVSFLAMGMYLPRRFDSPVYGTYQYVPMLAQAVPMAVAVPLAKAITYFVPRTRNPGPVLRATALVLAAAGIVAGLVLAFVPGVWSALLPANPHVLPVRGIVGAIVAFGFGQAVSDYVLIVRGRRMAVAKLLLLQSVWNVLGIGGAAMVARPEQRLEWTLLALLVSTAIPSVVAFWWLLAPAPAAAGDPGPTRRAVLAYTLPLTAAVGVNYLAGALDKFLVPHLFPMDENREALDHYLRAAMEVPVLGAVSLTLLGLVAPRLAELHGRGDREGLLGVWRGSCRKIAVATLPLTGLLCAVGTEAFTLVYGDRYEPAVPIFRWYLLKIVLAVFLPQILLESVGATVRSLAFSGVAMVAAVAATAALVPVFGLAGAAAASVVAALATNWLFGGWLACRALDTGWHRLADWGHLARLLATCTGAACAAIWLVPGDLLGDGSAVASWIVPERHADARDVAVRIVAHLQTGLLHGAAYAAAFVLLARLLRSVSREDLEMLRGLVRRRRSAA